MAKKIVFKPQEKKTKRVHFVKPSPMSHSTHFKNSENSAAIIAIGSGYLNAKCIEACRRVVRRAVKRTAKLRICLNPFLPVTTKPSEVRMGKGKGKIDRHLYPVPKGKVIFELSSRDLFKCKAALRKTQSKLPFDTRLAILNDRD